MRLRTFAQIVGVISSKKNFNISEIASKYRFDFNQVKEAVAILEKTGFVERLEDKSVYRVVK